MPKIDCLCVGFRVLGRLFSEDPVNHFHMIRQNSDISSVKKTISDYFQKQVDVTVNLGRNKIVRFCGRLSGVYPALFTVSPDDKNFLGKTSYSYAEVLCGNVKIKPL